MSEAEAIEAIAKALGGYMKLAPRVCYGEAKTALSAAKPHIEKAQLTRMYAAALRTKHLEAAGFISKMFGELGYGDISEEKEDART